MIKKFNEMDQVNERFTEDRTELKGEILESIQVYLASKYDLSEGEIRYIIDNEIETEINTLSENILLKVDMEN